ncbi:MAG: DUF4241 domain-containing protein [Pseudomonadota bacterium]
MPRIDLANLNALFMDDAELAHRKLARTPIGTLIVTSGAVVACDPIVQPERPPFERRVAPGRYAVEYLQDASKPALLVLWLRERSQLDPATLTWEMAILPGMDPAELADDEYYGYPVDAGWGCLMDADAARAMAERAARAEAEDPDFDNYYQAFLEGQAGECSAFEHCPGEPGTANVLLCESGWGDGNYPSYWALDPQGEPVALVTDFMVIENGDGRDADEIAEAAYLASLPPEKLAALEALQQAVEAGDADAAARICADGLAGANEIIPSSSGTAIFEAIRLDQPAVLAALLAGGPCPELPARLRDDRLPDYLAYARRLRKKRSRELMAVLRAAGSTTPLPPPRPLPGTPFTLVPAAALVDKYELDHLHGYATAVGDSPLIAVHEGDLTLAELDLEYPEELSADQPVGYVVAGNLHVTGNILNKDTDGAIGLVVLGDLHAGNIAVGGQVLYVRGNVTVDGVYCGSYNHGESMIDGDVTARLLLSDDYLFWIKGRVRGPTAGGDCDRFGLLEGRARDLDYDGRENGLGYGGARWVTGDVPIPFAVVPECLDEDTSFNFYALLERLRGGQPVIHPECVQDSPKLASWREASTLFQQAEAAYCDDENTRAAVLYEEAEAAGYPAPECRYTRALCHYEDDEVDAAIPLFDWCIDHDVHLEECLVKRASARMMQLNQDDDDVIDAEETYAAARADCERAIAAAAASGDNEYLDEAYNQLGYILYHGDHYEEALVPLARALELDEDNYNANSNMGKCLWHLDRNSEAILYLDKAIEADPDEDYPYLIKGHCLRELGQYEAAIPFYTPYLENHPDHVLARTNLVRCLIHLDRLTDAQAQAFELFERHPDHRLVNADGFMADELRDAERLEEALKHALISVRDNPEPGHHFYIKGLCQYDTGDIDGALATWEAYAEAAPEEMSVKFRIALAHAVLGHHEEALRWSRAILAIDPDNASIRRLHRALLADKVAKAWWGKGLVKLVKLFRRRT